MKPICVFGSGAFGTALAISIADHGTPVTLVARNAATAEKLQYDRSNERRLGGVAFPTNLRISDHLPQSVDTILLAVPTQKLRDAITPIRASLEGKKLVACYKGIERTTGLFAVKMLQDIVPNSEHAILSGPSFAKDIAAGLPTALTMAATDDALGAHLQAQLSTKTIRLYRTNDVTGVELGGALKNVMAIAAGITHGANLGESARASILTRGFSEMNRFAMSQGAQETTLAGLSGLGDLVLTCTSVQSRNYAFGVEVGVQGQTTSMATVEGKETAFAVRRLAQIHGISMPLVDLVCEILDGTMNIEQAKAALLSRPLKKE